MTIRGSFDGVANGHVFGWALDGTSAGSPVEVELWVDGKKRVVAKADIHRGDLEAAGIGDGRCAFSIAMPEKVYDGDYHELAVRTRSGTLLDHSPRWVICDE